MYVCSIASCVTATCNKSLYIFFCHDDVCMVFYFPSSVVGVVGVVVIFVETMLLRNLDRNSNREKEMRIGSKSAIVPFIS